jgi:hypothetical protein
MTDAALYRRAAVCYEQIHYWLDAARCHRAAGSPLRAATLHQQIGRIDLAVDDYQAAREYETAGWLLVHELSRPAAARAAVAPAEAGTRQALVLAHCDLAEGRPVELVLPAIHQACADLADAVRVPFPHRDLEHWAVAISELAGRYDQAALVFAAAVRGRRMGAAARWSDWALRTLGCQLVISEE